MRVRFCAAEHGAARRVSDMQRERSARRDAARVGAPAAAGTHLPRGRDPPRIRL